jgi:hypothetical protein
MKHRRTVLLGVLVGVASVAYAQTSVPAEPQNVEWWIGVVAKLAMLPTLCLAWLAKREASRLVQKLDHIPERASWYSDVEDAVQRIPSVIWVARVDKDHDTLVRLAAKQGVE